MEIKCLPHSKGPLLLDYDHHVHTIKVKIYNAGRVIRTVWQPVEPLLRRFDTFIRRVCQINAGDVITVKYADDEFDLCTVSSDVELYELLRLYKQTVEKDSNPPPITMHVFHGRPANPGDLCQGELTFLQRHGARRWRKVYVVGNHHYQAAARFNRNASCAVCKQKIWPLGLQAYRCIRCNLTVHKRCHRLVSQPCTVDEKEQTCSSVNGGSAAAAFLGTCKSMACLAPQPPDWEAGRDNCWNDLSFDDSLSCRRPEFRERTLSLDSLSCSYYGKGRHHSRHRATVIDIERREFPLKFNLLRVIGRGSYAKVFLAKERSTGHVCAVKVIKKSTLLNSDGDTEWINTEKHVFEQAGDHPFLVGLICSFQTDYHLFFVIEFVNGGDLMFHMQRFRRFSEDHARFYTAEISLALDFLHNKGILYRDLKLDNVLLDGEGHIKLTDYGMCKEGLAVGEKTNTFCGTPNYIAPEMLNGQAYGTSVDWWALGVLTFEMLVGRSPFDLGPDYVDNPDKDTEDLLFQIILEQPIRIPRFLSEKASSLLRGLLQKDPVHRLGCASADPTSSFCDLISHPFFKTIDFRLLTERKAIPPFRPSVCGPTDVSCFDQLFTKEHAVLTPPNSIRAKPTQLRQFSSDDEFAEFEHVSPLVISFETPN